MRAINIQYQVLGQNEPGQAGHDTQRDRLNIVSYTIKLDNNPRLARNVIINFVIFNKKNIKSV